MTESARRDLETALSDWCLFAAEDVVFVLCCCEVHKAIAAARGRRDFVLGTIFQSERYQPRTYIALLINETNYEYNQL